MKTNVKYTTDTKVELTITLVAKELEAAEQVALKKLSRDLKVPGFRKGHVPLAVAQKNIDPNALQEQTLENALSKAVAESFLGEKLQALERPAVEVKKFVPAQELEFTAEAEVVPPVKLGDYKKLKSKREEAKVTAADVDEIIQRMQENFVERKAVKREAKRGDEVIIDFTGKKDDVAFEGGSAKDYALQLGDIVLFTSKVDNNFIAKFCFALDRFSLNEVFLHSLDNLIDVRCGYLRLFPLALQFFVITQFHRWNNFGLGSKFQLLRRHELLYFNRGAFKRLKFFAKKALGYRF
jgi:RNAse (barnase) inhibitor barstar